MITIALVEGVLTTIANLRELSLVSPADGRVTQAFGVPSVTGIIHRGVDLSIVEGTGIAAGAAGTVITTRSNSWPHYGPLPPGYVGVDTAAGGYGNHVVLDHGGFVDAANWTWLISSMYAHLSRVDVAVGQRVAAGERIGRSGSTGISTGPHLHYEVRRSGDPFDPSNYIGLEVNELTEFSEEEKAALHKLAALADGIAPLAIAVQHAGVDASHDNGQPDNPVAKFIRYAGNRFAVWARRG